MDRAEQTAQGATDKAAQHGVAHGSSNVLAVSRPQWGRLAGVMALVVIVLGALPFLKGGLVIAKHEGDTLHLADIVLRMAEFGQVPHLDFMTPLGILSVAPIAWFVEAGINLGHAFFMAQLLVAGLLFVPAAYAAGTRLTMPWAALFGAYAMRFFGDAAHHVADHDHGGAAQLFALDGGSQRPQRGHGVALLRQAGVLDDGQRRAGGQAGQQVGLDRRGAGHAHVDHQRELGIARGRGELLPVGAAGFV